jgi:predicted homoserine dehydrogenase-like protein
MIIVDNALKKRERDRNPVRVVMSGAGFMGRGIARQICRYTPGMELVAIANRNLDNALRAYQEAGVPTPVLADDTRAIEEAVGNGRFAVTTDALALCRASGIDAVIEVTGAVEFGAQVALESIRHGKHVILMNAELDGTIGPVLKYHADRAGVVISNADGDQPGVILNLYRFVKSIGVQPVLCGNIKGLHDPYRNPTTQEGFARKWGQQPSMVTSFADGTKISFEQTIVANATGMKVGCRGMFGPTVPAGTPIQDVAAFYPLDALLQGPGIVDYVVGAHLGEGPLYCFYTPYHLCHFEVPHTVARAVLFHDAAVAPLAGPVVDVITAAKIDLTAGQELDGLGGYMTYGLCENHETTVAENLLPMGLAEGCRLRRDIAKDQVLTYDDVSPPEGRLCDRLREEQNRLFDRAPA